MLEWEIIDAGEVFLYPCRLGWVEVTVGENVAIGGGDVVGLVVHS